MFDYVLYHSRCVYDDFNVADLDILKLAIKANDTHAITGYLHREAGYYVQYFEGKPDDVAQLSANLLADRRHFGFTVLEQGQNQERQFEGWSMGYSNSPTTALGLVDRDDVPFKHTPVEVIAFLQVVAKNASRGPIS